MLAWLCEIVLTFAVLLGGGTHTGFVGDIIVQLSSIPLLAASLWSFSNTKLLDEAQRRGVTFFAFGIIVVIAIQLFPLPFEFPTIGGALTARPRDLGFLSRESSWSPVRGPLKQHGLRQLRLLFQLRYFSLHFNLAFAAGFS